MLTIRYFAAARAARGQSSEQVDYAGSLGGLVAALGTTYTDRTAGGMTLAQVFERCSFLLNGARVDLDAQLGPGDRLDVLPPFAGG
ncbi:MoaD/ThiS family protein [Corynebacterium liangguodongii]|uniref:Molybdopterin synthase sulfur carrier subunit n=1 Tax=Corynebacterium liangguodongii TaxID=2079535 RepID=A0A2S0WDT1_9CORY|nr:MoaD/ThiS family protein [Corynebacterium liangguodongii]AWB83921.1 molybdopterin synthase sulfur carrier subunit [Corynebacterium liangguodongii]PWB99060.1 MoaD/ThiS family protein [Corynebacterium liangguodongii]